MWFGHMSDHYGRSRQAPHTSCAACRPAFQAIIEALHQQMQQHVASEKAAAAAASVATARGVSPFGAMSNLMKVRAARAQPLNYSVASCVSTPTYVRVSGTSRRCSGAPSFPSAPCDLQPLLPKQCRAHQLRFASL